MQIADDLDFRRLSPSQFEELCFDLLVELGYQKLVWRQGGADSGRDIQGTRECTNPLVGSFEELWFFECKKYDGGVPPEALHSKIAWADAERPKHLVLFVSSYITNGARAWLSAIGRDKFYQIHLLEGKQLQQLVGQSHSLVTRYFPSDMQTLMQQTQRSWIVFNLIPEPWLLRTLAEIRALPEYNVSQLAFLWSTLKIRLNDLNQNMADSEGEPYDVLFNMLRQHANTAKPVLEADGNWCILDEQEGIAEYDLVYPKVYAAQVARLVDRTEHIAIYSLVRNFDGEGLEVLLYQDTSLSPYIRHIPVQASEALEEAKRLLHW